MKGCLVEILFGIAPNPSECACLTRPLFVVELTLDLNPSSSASFLPKSLYEPMHCESQKVLLSAFGTEIWET